MKTKNDKFEWTWQKLLKPEFYVEPKSSNHIFKPDLPVEEQYLVMSDKQVMFAAVKVTGTYITDQRYLRFTKILSSIGSNVNFTC